MIGNKIRTLRHKKGVSQEYLAEQLSVNQSTIDRLEQDKVKLDPKWVTMICNVLEVDVEELFCSDKVTISNNQFADNSSGYVNNLIISQKEAYEGQI